MSGFMSSLTGRNTPTVSKPRTRKATKPRTKPKPEPPVVDSAPIPAPGQTLELQLAGVLNHNTLYAYRHPSFRASLYINKRVFSDGVSVPQTLSVTAPGLREPAPEKTREELEREAQRLELKAQRAAERAERAQAALAASRA